MSMPSPRVLAALSREVAFTCDAQGVVLWADERADELLGLVPGVSLHDRMMRGSEEKLRGFLASAEAGSARDWELLLILGGEHRTVACRGQPHDGGVLVIGTLVSHDYDALLARMGETMSELSALHRETERQQRELLRLNEELRESGYGVRALHAELDERTEILRQQAAAKAGALANMAHELRTPINSILGFSKLLLARIDGDLAPEQERQLGYIARAATALAELVDELLDLSKLEAGKLALRHAEFELDGTFAALRGMFRPLATNPDVSLVLDRVAEVPRLRTDEGKLSQILRNLISNALKFTESGEVRVTAATVEGERVAIHVRDTGIGIAPDDQPRVFEEFEQVDSPIQRRVKGTGLGLPLARRLAELLGGTLTLESAPGAGSTFTVTIPVVHPELAAAEALDSRSRRPVDGRQPVLVIEDDRQTLLLYERLLADSSFHVIPAYSVGEARQKLREVRPAAVIMDVLLEGETSWSFLSEMKDDPATRDIPILVLTVVDREQKAFALGADEFCVKPIDRDWLLRKLRMLASRQKIERVLVIDDDDGSRYLLRRLFADTAYVLLEAATGDDGLRIARERAPQVILLDFVLKDETAIEIIERLRRDPVTSDIPVVIVTAKRLSADERRLLEQETVGILRKDSLSREVAIARISAALSKIEAATG